MIVDQLSYKFQEPERGEVVIFKYPKDQTRFFIKRIIGLPQETVEINDGKITIYKENKPEGLELEEEYIQNWSGENTKYILEENEYFVMGDNRTNSSDSRFWGPLPENLIVGRAFLRLLPVNQISAFPGNFDY